MTNSRPLYLWHEVLLQGFSRWHEDYRGCAVALFCDRWSEYSSLWYCMFSEFTSLSSYIGLNWRTRHTWMSVHVLLSNEEWVDVTWYAMFESQVFRPKFYHPVPLPTSPLVASPRWVSHVARNQQLSVCRYGPRPSQQDYGLYLRRVRPGPSPGSHPVRLLERLEPGHHTPDSAHLHLPKPDASVETPSGCWHWRSWWSPLTCTSYRN